LKTKKQASSKENTLKTKAKHVHHSSTIMYRSEINLLMKILEKILSLCNILDACPFSKASMVG
jgi:hypothetical protein